MTIYIEQVSLNFDYRCSKQRSFIDKLRNVYLDYAIEIVSVHLCHRYDICLLLIEFEEQANTAYLSKTRTQTHTFRITMT